jgi:hypothetical protein
LGLKDKGGDKITEEDEINKLLWELGITGFGYALEDRAKKEDKNNVWWNIAENLGKDMKENPEKYHELGEFLYNKFKEDIKN